jgi:1,4-dihydroxy-6-naphthoate synthase
MLLGLYLSKKPDVVSMPFDLIMPAVESGDLDFGVIIHEGRFTYKNYGLICLLDLGKWWEEKTSLPIPLGGIAIRRDIAPETARRVETAIRESTLYGFTHRTETESYIKKYAREMSSAVIRRHIDLYVNDFTIEIGEQGKEAIEALFEMASLKWQGIEECFLKTKCLSLCVRGLGSGFKVQGSRFRVQGSGFRVQGSRFKGSGL